MADEKTFLQGLVGGLIILAILVLLFGGTTRVGWANYGRGFGSSGWFSGTVEMPELIAADFATSTPVGAVITQNVEDIELGSFYVYGSPAVQSFPGGEVSSGLLFGEQSLKYSVSDLESVAVKIDQSNGYGALVIKVNGEIAIAEALNSGEHTFNINSKGPAEVEIVADSSFWKLWAPALYLISEVELKASENAEAYEFFGGDVTRGELVLDIEDSNDDGDLAVVVNGRSVYAGRASGTVSVDFANVNAGRNKVTVMAAPGASYSGSAVLKLVHTVKEVKVVQLQFNLTKAQADKLPGHITFEIPAVMNSGRVSVKLMVGDQTKLAESFDAEVGAQAVAIYPANVVPGEVHTVVIEGAENGAFMIRNLKVRV
jgi:hypothetical protein